MAYRLDLPSESRVHPVFHISLLKTYKGGPTPPLIPNWLDIQDYQREIQRILQHREDTNGDQVQRKFLVLWAGCGPEDTRWEDEDNLPKEEIVKYWERLSREQLALANTGPRVVPPRRSLRQLLQDQLAPRGDAPGVYPAPTREGE